MREKPFMAWVVSGRKNQGCGVRKAAVSDNRIVEHFQFEKPPSTDEVAGYFDVRFRWGACLTALQQVKDPLDAVWQYPEAHENRITRGILAFAFSRWPFGCGPL